ncbi:MAG: metallophosphoesterase family protein [Gemmatimonadales bacterium]|nr:MAG: metallophosphoesterase family protein [Gemmatimonadales bacterium]
MPMNPWTLNHPRLQPGCRGAWARMAPAISVVLALLLGGPPLLAQGGSGSPMGLLLTWQQDPLTTMTIDWHTGATSTPQEVRYRRVGASDWNAGPTPEEFPFPHVEDARIHRVELVGLEPGSLYEFNLSEGGRNYRFRTMPQDLQRPVRFASGGDVRHEREMMERMNRVVTPYDPDFILWAGDLAYADGLPERAYRWVDFLDVMMRTLITAEGRVIPVLAAPGNHEVRGGYYRNSDAWEPGPEWQREFAPFYYALFAFPGHPGYGVLDFADYLSIVLLDTDHTGPMAGDQTEWLRTTLRDRTHVPHVFPTYHVPAYPSVRSPDGGVSTQVRETWSPLFEAFGVRVAFEAHDHAFKRTHPIRAGAVHPAGVVYMGDGAWGVRNRIIGASHSEPAWYIDRALTDRHFSLVTLHGPHLHILTVNEDGRVIDEFPEAPTMPR